MLKNINILLLFMVCLISINFSLKLPISIDETNNLLILPPSQAKNSLKINNRPIIGILTQEINTFINRKYPGHNYQSYISASYVKFIEGAGARVVPIWIGQPRQYYVNILSKINGVLLPGGATFFNETNGFATAGKYIYDIATYFNDHNNYFPIWGTCLGFELLTYLSANNTEHRTFCHSQSQSLPLEFQPEFQKSRLYKQMPENIINILRNENVTTNSHMYCVTEESLNKLGLNNTWKILSTNHDWNNLKFISSIEHQKYPFYGIQFHPEKNLYEFIKNKNISHTNNAIQASQYFANFFINETRKNFNKFHRSKEESESLIYNYLPYYSGSKGSIFEQIYMFEQIAFNENTENIENDPNSNIEKVVNLVERQEY